MTDFILGLFILAIGIAIGAEVGCGAIYHGG